MLVSLSIVGLSCLILSLIVFNGKYFQNRINCAYSPHKQIFLTCWFLLFAYFAACLFCLIKTNSEKIYCFLRHAAFYFCVIYDKRLLLCGLRYGNGQRHAVSDFFRPSGSAAFREKTIFFDVDDIDSRDFASFLRVLRSDILFFGVRNLEMVNCQTKCNRKKENS